MTDWQRVLSSKLFRFLVGAEEREFMLHAEVVGTLSSPLNALVNGKMKESQEGCAIWPDTDEETFIRFSQYAYTGNYSPASPQKLQIPSPCPQEAAVARESDFDDGNTWDLPSVMTKKNKKSAQSKLWEAFKARQYVKPVALEPTSNKEDEDYSGVFLSHAQLFVFADCYQASNLEVLALHKLHHQLVSFVLFESRIGDIVQLIRYTYENTAQLTDSPCPLRDLVMAYSACKAKVLWKSMEFQNLFVSCGEFAGDLFSEAMKRMD